jgi:hypothetical protein
LDCDNANANLVNWTGAHQPGYPVVDWPVPPANIYGLFVSVRVTSGCGLRHPLGDDRHLGAAGISRAHTRLWIATAGSGALT